MWNWIVVGEEFRKPGVSMEFAFATAWLIRMGILIVVLGVGFGLQLSISRGVLGPAGRVAMSFLGGAAFLLAGVWCMAREKWKMLGQGFAGGGLAMFYFAFFAAATMFKLFPVTVSFAGMIVVTLTAVVVATRFNALSLAVLALLGGYVTPVVLQTDVPNYPVLYAYLAVLAVGMTIISFRRQWPLLTWLSLFFNSVLFTFAARKALGGQAGTGTALEISFLCAFFVVYSVALIAYTLRHRVSATPLEIIALFVNAFYTFGLGAFLIGTDKGDRMYLALLALGIAAFCVAHIWGFLVSKRFDRVVVSGFIALAAIFTGIAIPLLFTGYVLTSVFALQALAFLWLGRRLNAKMFYFGSFVFYAVMLLRMVIRFNGGDAFFDVTRDAYFATLAERLADFVVPIASLFAANWLIRHPEKDAACGVADLPETLVDYFKEIGIVLMMLFYAGLFLYATFELNTLLHIFSPSFSRAGVTILWALFALHLVMMRRHLSQPWFQGLAWLIALLVAWQWLFGGWALWEVRGSVYQWHVAVPRLLSTLACLSVLVGIWRTLMAKDGDQQPRNVFFYASLAIGFVYLTFEVAAFWRAFFRDGTGPWAVNVVWGAYALGMLLAGLRYNRKALRYLGLVLFAVTIGKVFLVDLAGADVLYRLVAFLALGAILLAAAYAYLRKRDTFQSGTEN